MRPPAFLPMASLVTVAGLSAGELNLQSIDRNVAREPTYKSGSPRYALLVLGPEATTRVWIVLDGSTLHVDRNGNADLTDDGGPLPVVDPDRAPRFRQVAIRGRRGEGTYGVQIQQMTWLQHRRGPGTEFSHPMITVNCPYKRRFQTGALQFASSPDKAPIIHAGGPLEMRLLGRPPLRITGAHEYEISAAVGSPGLGSGTFAALSYNVISEDAAPKVVVHFPAGSLFEPAGPAEVRLVQRSCGSCFRGTVHRPATAGRGPFTVRCSFEAWSDGNVRAIEFEVPDPWQDHDRGVSYSRNEVP